MTCSTEPINGNQCLSLCWDFSKQGKTREASEIKFSICWSKNLCYCPYINFSETNLFNGNSVSSRSKNGCSCGLRPLMVFNWQYPFRSREAESFLGTKYYFRTRTKNRQYIKNDTVFKKVTLAVNLKPKK